MDILVKGYMVHNMTEENETLFAVYPDGTIKTCTKKFSNKFNEKGIEWHNVSDIPSEAEFIGNYYMSRI